MKKVFLILLFTSLVLFQLVHAQVTDTGRYGPLLSMHPLYQSQMVLQQGAEVEFAGSAESGTRVVITSGWGVTATTVADTGNRWTTTLKTPTVRRGDFTNYKVVVENNSRKLLLDSVQIGEVWLCSGQSNMEMTMDARPPWHEGVLNREVEIAAASYPNLRVLTIKRQGLPYLRQNFNGTWESISPDVAANTSGVAYYFARLLQQRLQVPIGIVVAAHGGAACQAFISRESLQEDTLLNQKYLSSYIYDPQDKNPEYKPSLLFQAMINPLKLLKFKGVLWYQGESNAKDTTLYPILQKTLISSWKQHFNKSELPFYYVQMPAYDWKKQDPSANDYSLFREAQERTLLLPKTGMVCTMDIGEPDNIHPRNKKPVGERLAVLALAETYELKVVHSGPRVQSIRFKGTEAIITYKKSSAPRGIQTSDGKAPAHFFISGKNKEFYEATVSVKGRIVKLSAPEVLLPIEIRYAFTNDAVTNFQNKEGLPAFPFRTDNWSHAKYHFKKSSK